LKLFHLLQSFYSVEEFVSSSDLPMICIWLVIIENINSQIYVDLFVCILLKRFYKAIHMVKIYYKLTSLLSYVW
jgi:hypothetical protein